eukprot:3462810-Pleurochrysis_carterae.AAC.2
MWPVGRGAEWRVCVVEASEMVGWSVYLCESKCECGACVRACVQVRAPEPKIGRARIPQPLRSLFRIRISRQKSA